MVYFSPALIVGRDPGDGSGDVGSEGVLVWIVSAILPSERNGVVNEKANHALFQGVLCGFKACFVDLPGAVDREPFMAGPSLITSLGRIYSWGFQQ